MHDWSAIPHTAEKAEPDTPKLNKAVIVTLFRRFHTTFNIRQALSIISRWDNLMLNNSFEMVPYNYIFHTASYTELPLFPVADRVTLHDSTAR